MNQLSYIFVTGSLQIFTDVIILMYSGKVDQ